LLTGVFFFEGDGELAGPFSTPSGSTSAGIFVSSGIVGPYLPAKKIHTKVYKTPKYHFIKPRQKITPLTFIHQSTNQSVAKEITRSTVIDKVRDRLRWK